MKILFADKFPQAFLKQLENAGHACTLEPNLTAVDLPRAAKESEILVVRSTRVEKETIKNAGNLKMIIRAGAGTNTIDKDTAAVAKVYVCNVPGKNAIAVAELAMGLLIAIDRNIPDNVSQIRQAKWDKKRFSEAKGLFGRSIGVIGLGAIGMAVAERAAAFGMKLFIIRKPERAPEVSNRLTELGATELEDLHAVAANCDVLSFHTPASEETKKLVNEELLAAMRPGTILLNTSRGDLIDEPALIKAMDEKGIRAGLDVYMDEPAATQANFVSELAQHPNVYGTHHIGASTEQAQNAVAEGVIDIIEAFQRGHIMHCVNMKF
ncbi:MAG: NAD(P)-dependent oxidoreductase [Arenicellales bacterium]|nr:NAD(P)-dependent oxidoreductase [Arenicellales bacterium]